MLAHLCLKSFKLGFSSVWTENFQMYNLDLEKAEEPEWNCQHMLDHRKSKGIPKNVYFCFIDYAKAFTVHITTNCGKSFKRWEYQTTWPASWETCMQVRKQQLELDMEQ